MFSLRSTALLALLAPTLAAAPLTIEFTPADPLTLDGLRYETHRGEELGDASRLVLGGKAAAEHPAVTLEAARFGRDSFGDFQLKILGHPMPNGDPASRLLIRGSTDGESFEELKITPGEVEKRSGGYLMTTMHHSSFKPVRFLKIGFRDLPAADYWKCQLAALTFPDDAATANTGAVTVEFKPGEPVLLNGLRHESFNGDLLKEHDRLIITGKPGDVPPSVVIDGAKFGRKEFRNFEIKLISHYQLNARPESKLRVYGSADAVEYRLLEAAPAGKDADLTAGYRRTSLKGSAPEAIRFLKLEIRDLAPADSWKLQLAAVTLPAPVSAEFARKLRIRFDDATRLKLVHLRPETWQADQLKLAMPRLTLDPKKMDGTGELRIDLTNFDDTEAFQELKLSVLAQTALAGKPEEFLQLKASANGRDWVVLSPTAGTVGDPLPGGYRLCEYSVKTDRPYRFLSIAIQALSNQKYWLLQLAGLELTVNGDAAEIPAEPEKLPGEKRHPADPPAIGARLELKIHTLGLNRLKSVFKLDGQTVAGQFRDTGTDGGGWRTREIEIWGDKPFSELLTAISSEPEWAVKLEKTELIRNRAQDQAEHLGAAPEYQLARDQKTVHIPRIHGAFLYGRDALGKTTFDDVSWSAAELSEQGFRAHSWGSLPLLREADREIYAALYRFALNVDFDPQTEDLELTLPQSSFVTTVFVDGREAAHFTEGFLPLRTILNEQIRPGKSSELIIRVGSYRFAHDPNGKVLYPVGAMGPWTSGLTMPPVLSRVPKLRADGVFVTSGDGTVTLNAQLVNRTDAPKTGTARLVLTSLDGRELFSEKRELKLPANASAPVSAEFRIGDQLKRWDIGKPELYLARVDLETPAGTVPGQPVRFGYRTVEVRGDSLYLNGRKIRLFGPWAHIGEWTFRNTFEGKSLSQADVYRAMLRFGMNTGRLHCQPYHRSFYEAADEAGFLLIAESALAHRPANQAALDHVANFVKEYRNHPSIIIWSGSNEFEHWLVPRPQKTMDFLVEVQRKIKELDPTRPVQHSGFGDANGELDIHSVHYPAETGGFPRSLYWTRDLQLAARIYQENFTRFNPVGKKPLAYGEERIPGFSDTSFLFGEAALRDFYDERPEARERVQKRLARDWALRTRAEREQNVLLICPNIFYLGLDSVFVRELGKEFRPAGVYPRFFNPALSAGKPVGIPAVYFDDAGFGATGTATFAFVGADGRRHGEKRVPRIIRPGETAEETVELTPPTVATDTVFELESSWSGADGKIAYLDRTPVLVAAPTPPQVPDGELFYWGDPAKLAAFAARHRLKINRIASLAEITGNRPAVMIGPDVPEAELLKQGRAIADKVAAGARIILAERNWSRSFLPSDAVWNNRPDDYNCIGFVRDAEHPVMKQLHDLELRLWNKNGTVARGGAVKPEHGNFRILADTGDKLSGALLWELIHGNGFYLINQFDLLDNLDRLPQAERLLAALLSHALTAPAPKLLPGAVLHGTNDFSAGVLFDLGWLPADRAPEAETLAVTTEALRELGVESVAERAKKFRQVIFFNAPPDAVAPLAVARTGSAPQTVAAPSPNRGRYFFIADRELYNGIHSGELNWGKEALPSYAFSAGNGWDSALAHGADAFRRDADGRLTLFCNLPVDRDVPDSGMKSRFLARLSTGLGVRLESKAVKDHDPAAARYAFVELSGVANARRSDFFDPKLPSGTVKFHDVPFRLADEKAAGTHGMFRFNAHSKLSAAETAYDTPVDRFTIRTPEKVTIPLPREQADSIYFLHTTNRNWKIERFRNGNALAEYRILFADGTSTRLPVISGQNVADCRTATSTPRARLAATWPMPQNGDGENATIHLYEWENPTPEKKIRAIEVINLHNPPHDLLLFGITLREPVELFN